MASESRLANSWGPTTFSKTASKSSFFIIYYNSLVKIIIIFDKIFYFSTYIFLIDIEGKYNIKKVTNYLIFKFLNCVRAKGSEVFFLIFKRKSFKDTPERILSTILTCSFDLKLEVKPNKP